MKHFFRIWIVFAMLASGPMSWATPPFFVMDTCVARVAPSVALPLIKQIGFDGFGDSEKTVLANLPLLARERMRLVNVYFVVDLAADQAILSEDLRAKLDQLAESGPTALWVAIQQVTGPAGTLASSDVAGDALVLEKLKELNAYARPRNLRIALYPHAQFWLQRVEDAARIARAMDDANVGITFNLCHWLKVEGDKDPAPVLEATLPLLFFVTINGADRGDTQSMEWNRLIKPLGEGDYDVSAFLKTLESAGYRGPIGLQGYGISGDPAENLIKSFSAWKRFVRMLGPAGKQ